MEEKILEDSPDRLIVSLDPGGPIELADLSNSFKALARLYERKYVDFATHEHAPRLFVTRLESGSVVAEIVPYAVILSGLFATAETSVVIADFMNRLWSGIKAFSDPSGTKSIDDSELPSKDDAEDLRAFVSPLTGKNGAHLRLTHARYEKTEKKTILEYKFSEAELNRASVNIDHALSKDIWAPDQSGKEDSTSMKREVVMILEQANRRPGKDKGRTNDRAIVPEISPKSVPVYFRKSVEDLKQKMIKGDVNPLDNAAYVVDVHVTTVDGEPKVYTVTEVHKVLPFDE